MFYSHEILTSRKHGVATIWLMATLGSKSSNRKITKRAILDVNLPKACETISEPEVPLALRLQGSLLLGVSRVFKEKCEYIKVDVDNLSSRMRNVKEYVKEAQIDHSLEFARPDQLNIVDDPAFDIDVDLGFDLSLFDTDTENSLWMDYSSNSALISSQSSLQIVDENTDRLPALDFDEVNFMDPAPTDTLDPSGNLESMHLHKSHDILTDRAIFEDTDFFINDDGELIIDQAMANEPLQSLHPHTQEDTTSGPVPLMATIGEFEEQNFVSQDVDPMSLIRDVLQAPMQTDNVSHIGVAFPSSAPDERSNLQHETERTETTAGAPHKRQKACRPPKPDFALAFSNRELSEWNTNYLKNMSRANQDKLGRLTISQAQRNAAFWILDQGIGGVEVNFGSDLVPHPLSIFSGKDLLSALTGQHVSRKRAFSSSESDRDDRVRRYRVRSETSRDPQDLENPVVAVDEAVDLPWQDEFQPESEVGRQAPSSLREHSTQMPWNRSSRQDLSNPYGSAFQRTSSVPGISGGFDFGPRSSLQHHRMRITSASPLLGKGQQMTYDVAETPAHENAPYFDIDELEDMGQDSRRQVDDQFELYGVAADISTQEAVRSQWMAKALENETYNFLTFLKAQIEARNNELSEFLENTTTFMTLLPPSENSHIVAAQGFLHVLGLVTMDLIDVVQEEQFGDIEVALKSPPAAVPVEDNAHGEEQLGPST